MDQQADAIETAPTARKKAWPLRLSGWLFGASVKLALIGIFVAVGLFVGGFLKFAVAVSDMGKVSDVAAADGIVALTGGSRRIEKALDLMQQRKGQRLLISGVNEATPVGALRKLHPTANTLFDCCVDIERAAMNTVGNAKETAKWVRRQGYKNLIVVTSAYHMPRSLLEFRNIMPDINLMPFAVQSDHLKGEDWWHNSENLRVVMSEYLKYLGAHLRRYVPSASFAALQRAATWV